MKRIYFPLIALTVLVVCFIAYASAENNNSVAENENLMTDTEHAMVLETVENAAGKVLVAYFTSPETDGVDAVAGASRVIVNGDLYGNTQYIGEIISEATGGELFAIKTVNAYPSTHKALIDFAKEEAESKARPKLSARINNFGDYDVIFVGFPNWWYDMPMPLYTFFEEYDFTSKTIIPFCTHGGSRFSQAEKTIASLEKGAKMVKGLSVSRDNVVDAKPQVLKWLSNIKMVK